MATATATAAFSSVLFLPSLSSTRALAPRSHASFPTRPVKPSALLAKARHSSPPTFVRNVSVSSDVEQEEFHEEEEEEVVGESDGEVGFSSDLKLFVGNLPFSVDSAELAGLFGRAGTVEMVEVIYDKATGRSRGFGFVTMSTTEEVEAAAQQFNGYELNGRPLRVNSGPPPPRNGSPPRGFRTGGGSFSSANRAYVGNLSWGVDDLALETLFSEQGKVMEAKVVYDRNSGRSRGFGFVTFSSPEEVSSAISSLNGAELNGRAIYVTMAEPRPPRHSF